MFGSGMCLLILFFMSTCAVIKAIPLRDFYNFTGNFTCLRPIDDSSLETQVAPGYTFFGEYFESIYVTKILQ